MRGPPIFPSVDQANEDGILAVGGDFGTEILLEAYRGGIFPWPISADLPLAWFSPDPRGVISLDEMHVPRSFQKFLRKTAFNVTFNHSFDEVILGCARISRKNQPGTWITPALMEGYRKLFQIGKAYSVEVWHESKLVAGLYGVSMGEFCSGESMFTKVDDGSKLALYSLLMRLRERGIPFLDTQMVTSVVENFGGRYLPRSDFMESLETLDWSKPREEIFAPDQGFP
jgi:leucyl/phenylalanyl-tRNA---protein transferase